MSILSTAGVLLTLSLNAARVFAPLRIERGELRSGSPATEWHYDVVNESPFLSVNGLDIFIYPQAVTIHLARQSEPAFTINGDWSKTFPSPGTIERKGKITHSLNRYIGMNPPYWLKSGRVMICCRYTRFWGLLQCFDSQSFEFELSPSGWQYWNELGRNLLSKTEAKSQIEEIQQRAKGFREEAKRLGMEIRGERNGVR